MIEEDDEELNAMEILAELGKKRDELADPLDAARISNGFTWRLWGGMHTMQRKGDFA